MDMVSDLDIERSASVLIESRGYEGAAIHAAAMVVAMERDGDEQGGQVWRRIAAAIRVRSPNDSKAVH